MTEDYKNKMLGYITNTLNIEEPKNNSFRDNEIIQNNLIDKLKEKNIENSIIMRILTTDTTTNYLVYGSYNDTSENKRCGYIAVLDQSGNILEIITTYESGTKLGAIDVLNYDENDNIYGIDTMNDKERVILLNNVALKTYNGYICKLRASYYIPTSPYFTTPFTNLSGTSYIKKSPEEAVYYMFGCSQNKKTMLIKFTINVGSSNEWEYFYGSTISGNGSVESCDFILETSEGTTSADVYYVPTNSRTILYHERFNGTSMSSVGNINLSTFINDYRMLNKDKVYVSSRVNNEDGTYEIILYEIDNNIVNVITSYNIEATIPSHYLNLVNGILFTKVSGYLYGAFRTICGVYNGETFTRSPVYDMEIENYIDTPCTIQKTFSLYKFIVQGASVVYKPSIVIYDNQYSGASYENYNSLVPLHSELYSNNYIVFARTLYNNQVYQNVTVSTVNVPNNFLNDIIISPSELLSTTMTKLSTTMTKNNTNTDNISKNIYENLFINFNNRISVIDEDTNTLYPETANYINVSVNTGNQEDYEGSGITKIRINYQDGTNSIQRIYWGNEDNTKIVNFSIYVPKEIITIEFINENEDFVYITKEYDFETNKYYKICQKIRIE